MVIGPIAFEPVARQHTVVGIHGRSNLATADKQRERKGRPGVPSRPSRAHPRDLPSSTRLRLLSSSTSQ